MKRSAVSILFLFASACGAQGGSVSAQGDSSQGLSSGNTTAADQYREQCGFDDLHFTTIAGFPALEARAQGPSKGKVLFIHGSFADHLTFAPFLRSFAEAGYDGIAFARRGRDGVPPLDANGVTFDEYLDDVHKVMAAIGEPVIVVGHSLGGLLAQRVAVEGGATAVAILSSAPPGPLTTQDRTLPYLAPYFPAILGGTPFKPTNSVFDTIALNGIDPIVQDLITDTFTAESGLVYASMIYGVDGPASTATHAPMLVLGGGNDWLISEDLLTSTAQAYNAPLEIFPNNGHWLIDAPNNGDVSASIINWLADVLPKHH